MILELQKAILEMIARGEGLVTTIDRLCRDVEIIAPGIACTVLAVKDGRLHPLASPSLPDYYSRAIENLPTGPFAGSCGTAAHFGKAVIVTDIANDPRWAAYKDMILPLGFKACWSTPIMVGKRVAATFAFYYRDIRGPNAVEQQIVDACVNLCSIAIERYERVLERERLTYTDTLTGLANRARFNRTLAGLRDIGAAFGILLVDIDNLKLVNDTFGHAAGDGLIVTVANRISLIASSDSTFRLGGDEFAVIVQIEDEAADAAAGSAEKKVEQQLAQQAEAILATLLDTCECAGHVVFPRATIGGAACRSDATDADEALRNADIALYHAKEHSRGHYLAFSDGLGTAITRRFRAIRDVGLALTDNRIHAFYQPIVRLDTGEIVGFEALCRMRTTGNDIVAAAHFHEATKDALVAAKLTQCMIEKVAGDMRDWLDAGLPLQHVSINLSAADLHAGNLDERLKVVFDRAGVSLSHVILEVTESVYFGRSGPDIAEQIGQLRSSGLRVALDDFGTGYASLTHLLSVPVDIIKIDKSFVDHLTPQDPARFIVGGVIDIASKLGMKVVAEGIEDMRQAKQLAELGCALGQGYLFSAAVDAEKAADLLRQRGHLPQTASRLRA